MTTTESFGSKESLDQLLLWIKMLSEPVDHALPMVSEIVLRTGPPCPVSACTVMDPNDFFTKTPHCVVHLSLVCSGDVPITFA